MGIIGFYRGQEVYVIDYKDFTYEMSKGNPEILYAVKRNDDKLDIVENGLLIGAMTYGGSIDIFAYKHRHPYAFYQKKEAFITTKHETVVEDYSQYAEVVNEFFDGLEQLWAEIDASFVEVE